MFSLVVSIAISLLMFEVIPDILNALGEILVGGIRIQTETTGNLCDCQVIVETETEDAAVRFLQLLLHEDRDIFQLLQLSVNGLQVGIVFYGHQSLHFVVKMHLSDSVQAGITHSSEEIRVVLGRNVTVGNTQKDVLHHVLSLAVIAQQDSGQMNHLAEVLAEKPFYYSLIKHISLSDHCTRFKALLYIRHFSPIVFLRKHQLFSFFFVEAQYCNAKIVIS